MKNYVALVVDESGSMQYLAGDAISAFNGVLETVKAKTFEQHQETLISLYKFSSRPERVYDSVGVSQASPLTHGSYRPAGQTALRDAVALAIADFSSRPDAYRSDVSFLVIVVTDGQENNSIIPESHLRDMIVAKQATDRWTFTFNMPPGAGHYATRFGVPAGNVREWEQTRRGMGETRVETEKGIGSYFEGRSRGATYSANFYDVTPDLSKLKSTAVKKALTDVKADFKVLQVQKEEVIKDRVEAQGLDYRVGDAYYQLTKRELVQPHKDVLLMEKGKSAIWGGAEARDLLGLPANAGAKVTPGNHANYDIFVQSTSTNRKLVRGTKLLVKR
jgi:hypothetical protein